jgi:hypothetical protein
MHGKEQGAFLSVNGRMGKRVRVMEQKRGECVCMQACHGKAVFGPANRWLVFRPASTSVSCTRTNETFPPQKEN